MSEAEFYEKYQKLPEEAKGIVDAIFMHMYPEETNKDNWIPVSEAAEILGISGQTVRVKIKEGIIPFRNTCQRKTVVDKATVERLAQYN